MTHVVDRAPNLLPRLLRLIERLGASLVRAVRPLAITPVVVPEAFISSACVTEILMQGEPTCSNLELMRRDERKIRAGGIVRSVRERRLDYEQSSVPVQNK